MQRVLSVMKLEMTEEVEVRGDCGRCVWRCSMDRGAVIATIPRDIYLQYYTDDIVVYSVVQDFSSVCFYTSGICILQQSTPYNALFTVMKSSTGSIMMISAND